MNEQMTLTQSFLFISDAGHGWLKAPLTDLALLGIEQEISCAVQLLHQGSCSVHIVTLKKHQGMYQ